MSSYCTKFKSEAQKHLRRGGGDWGENDWNRKKNTKEVCYFMSIISFAFL